MAMGVATLLQVLQTGSLCVGILVAIGTLRSRKDEDVSRLAEMMTDIRYIKQAVSEIDGIERRLTVVEQAIKCAKRPE